jgi:sugar lactone lactonase YvrE
MAYELTTLLDGGDFFEGPRWHDGQWYVSDMYGKKVFTVTTDGKAEKLVDVPGNPSGLGFLPDGSLLIVSMHDYALLRRSPEGEVTVHADLSGRVPGHLNDMVVDAEGRAWVGNIGFPTEQWDDDHPEKMPATVLMRVDLDGTATEVADGLRVPNGTVITPDGKTLIIGEALGFRYTEFTINDDGTLSEGRLWGQLPSTSAPDGCTMDAEGHIWMADPYGAVCRRLKPGGETVDVIEAPEGMSIFACMLGGDDGRTMLLCCGPMRAFTGQHPGEGFLATTIVDVPHMGLP